MKLLKICRKILHGEPISAPTAGCLVFTLSILMLLPLLSFVEIYNVGEGREGSVVKEILKGGSLILPLRNGEIVPSKPPLYHWLACLPALATGSVDSWEIRLPSALAGIGTVGVIFWLLNSTVGTSTALIGSLILLTSEGFVAVSAEGRVDSVFSFFLALALASALRGLVQAYSRGTKEIDSRYIVISSIACGLSVLTKGPVGWIITGLVVVGFLLLFQGPSGLRQLLRREVLLIFALPLPWYLAATVEGGEEFIGRQLIYENIRRFTGGAGITGHTIWYYPYRLFVFCAPWACLLPLMGFWKLRDSRIRESRSRTLTVTQLVCRAGAVWFFIPIVFLSLASGKHSAYLMPLLPGLAILLATWIASKPFVCVLPSSLDRLGVFIAWCVLLSGPLALTILPALHTHLHHQTALISEFFIDAIAPRAGTILALYVIYGSTTWLLVCTRNKRTGALRQWGPVLIGLLCICIGVYVRVGRAIKGWLHGDRPLAAQIMAHVRDEERINWVLPRGSDEKLGVGRDDSFDTVFFYLDRHVARLDIAGSWQQPGVYVARRSWVEQQPPDWRARLRMRAEGGKLDDLPGDRLWIFDLLPKPASPEVQ